MSKQTALAGHEVAPTAGARRAVRPRAVAGGLAVALLLPSALMPAAGLAQTTSGEAPALPELSPDPVATPKKPAKKAKAKVEVKGASASSAPARYKVRSGQSLWTISERIAGPGASPTKVANTLVAIWNLNDIRIGTGNPDVLPIGVNLKIPASLR